MSNYPYYPPVPPQGQPVPGQGYSAYSGSAPPQYAPAQPQYTNAPSHAQPYGYQHQPYQQPPLQYQQHAHEQPPPQPPRPPQQQYNHGLRPSDPAAPALPPRPTGISNRLMAQSILNFPPPPRSPNRPPELPPRPQQSQPPHQHAQMPHQQAYGQPPAYNPAPPRQPSHSYQHIAHPTTTQNYVPPPPPLPSTASNPVYQQDCYPPPPPGPPPPVQPVSPVSTVSSAQTPPQPGNRPAAAGVSPPMQHTSGTQFTPVERQPLCEQQSTQSQSPPPPPPPPPSASTTSYAHTYGQTYPEQPAAVSAPPPTQSPPQVHVKDTGVSNASAASTSSGSMDEMLSMVERLNLKQPTSLPAPEPVPEPRAFVAELSGESGTHHAKHVKTIEPPAAAPTPTTTYARPSPPPLQTARNAQSPRSGPRPAYVSDIPDISDIPGEDFPLSSASAPLPVPTSPQDIPKQQHEQTQHSSPPSAPLVQKLSTPLPPPAPLQEQYVDPPAQQQVALLLPPVPPAAQEQVTPPPQQATPVIRQQQVPPPQAAEPFRDASAAPPFRPVTHCIDTPVTFSTWWYSHDSAPDYTICSKCYIDYIYPTIFQNQFSGRYLTDGATRRCRFNVPRITKQLLPDAVSRGTLDTIILFMNQRMRIKDCKGEDGATGAEGMKWYAVKNNQLPGFVACAACYQDIVCMSQFAFSFEDAPGQGEKDTWTCDLFVPYIRREFELRTKLDDWPTFLGEAKARMGMPACPKAAPTIASIRKWFVPVEGQGPPDAVLCVGCYCDCILNSGQESLWQQQKQENISVTNFCIMGIFRLRMALCAAVEEKQWPLFWTSLNRIAYQEKACTADGIVDGNWYTLPSQPDGYNVCGSCYAGIVQNLHLEPFFVPRTTKGPAPGDAHVCSFNKDSPRFVPYVRYMLQTWYTSDCADWDAYASRCAAFPPCPRDADDKMRAWYGWPECVICADCYMDVVRGTALDTPERMAFHQPAVLEQPHICEMYSPRMRKLYQTACSSSPPSTVDLFAYVEQRRLVYWQTIPRCRQILVEEKLLANQIGMARISSTFYTGAGGLESINHRHHHTYGAPGVGYGFDNILSLQGAQYNAQANAMSSQLGGGKILLVGQLEQQWRAIE